ncbi:acetyl-CoA carboxylase subunit beta [Helicobacter enhydrae]|uniref:Acetyl-coenzyme A carboxylase carboxyl transferase subunit beta n=1 Tax=Helicobacter enhydrae TaxID=222136 RepID=A0A1B1U6H3_9HELI|nr:acetyl-CoA carboxylase, carboxyltransferase subunit beta [Helicobacter enhydrae]ANV98285.1 acetyl-CoA carboxylase subunit beta [Helicobacter enhydrae]
MGLEKFFSKFRSSSRATSDEAPSHWVKCPKCNAINYYKEVLNQQNVCPKCTHHFKISAQERINLLCDTFVEYDQTLAPKDPLNFVDKKSYKKRIEEGVKKTRRPSSIISGEGLMFDEKFQLVVFDFAFMGGSLSSVEGEKILRAIKRCIDSHQALVIVSTSGGARMQESTFSLMQMAKTSAALNSLSQHKLPFISLLTDPTYGGVSASFAFLGDIIIAEPGANIGFAGPRVIKQTIGADLPEGFQTAEFLLECGLIDMVKERKDLKETIYHLIKILKPK